MSRLRNATQGQAAPRRHLLPLLALVAAQSGLGLLASQPLIAQAGPLFPEPFRVEHQLVQDDGDGNRFVGEPVVDTYGGSWIVSQRPDGSRLIVDLVRHELTEVQPGKGTYWTLSFDRLAELQGRLQRAQGTAPGEETAAAQDALGSGAGAASASPATRTGGAAALGASDAAAPLVVTEVAVEEKAASTAAASTASATTAAASPEQRPGVKHLRVTQRDVPGAALDVWVDPSVRFTPAAQAAIGAMESQMLSAGAGRTGRQPTSKSSRATAPATPLAGYLAAARAHAAGALPVRTVRPLAPDVEEAAATLEDVASRVERLERFPSELAEIPEGLRRVPHPLEATVRFLEEEAARNAAMSGVATPSN